MAFINKTASELRTQEAEIHAALKSWYLTPGLQRELRHKENEAVQSVLELLTRRRGAAGQISGRAPGGGGARPGRARALAQVPPAVDANGFPGDEV